MACSFVILKICRFILAGVCLWVVAAPSPAQRLFGPGPQSPSGPFGAGPRRPIIEGPDSLSVPRPTPTPTPVPTPRATPTPLSPEVLAQYNRTIDYLTSVAAVQRDLYIKHYVDGYEQHLRISVDHPLRAEVLDAINQLPTDGVEPIWVWYFRSEKAYSIDLIKAQARIRQASPGLDLGWLLKPVLYVAPGDSGTADEIIASQQYDEMRASQLQRREAQKLNYQAVIEEERSRLEKTHEAYLHKLGGMTPDLRNKYGVYRLEEMEKLAGTGKGFETASTITYDDYRRLLPGQTIYSGHPIAIVPQPFRARLNLPTHPTTGTRELHYIVQLPETAVLSVSIRGQEFPMAYRRDGVAFGQAQPFTGDVEVHYLDPQKPTRRQIKEFRKQGPAFPGDQSLKSGPGTYMLALSPGFYSVSFSTPKDRWRIMDVEIKLDGDMMKHVSHVWSPAIPGGPRSNWSSGYSGSMVRIR